MNVRVVGAADLPHCLAVRRAVFVDEQQVPEALEVDGLDPVCVHVLAQTDAGVPIGTARLRIKDGAAKIERVAVLAAYRGTGLGVAVMDAVEAEARRMGLARAVLNAQVSVLGFYARLGYTAHGPVFDDAGIPHRAMSKPL